MAETPAAPSSTAPAVGDPLSRAELRAALASAIAAQPGEACAILSVGLDRFDDVNSVFGYEGGDEVLAAVGARLDAAFEHTRIAGVLRGAGDEFALWVRVDEGGVQPTLAALGAAFARPFVVDGEPLLLHATAGAALYPQHGVDAGALLRRAHLAMRAAKRDRRDFALYHPDATGPALANVRRLRDLRGAIARNRLQLHYQPQIDVATGAVTGCEALLRWPTASGVIAPGEFLPLCERTGLMLRLDRWVLATAARQLAAWQGEGLRVPLSVNVSARTFESETLPDAVFAAVDLWGIDGHDLRVEVTEPALVADPARAVRVARRLADLGVAVTIDDFGTRSCPFAYLREFHAGSAKIARAFVGAAAPPAGSAIALTLIELGARLGLDVVAKGVEDEATLTHLRALGCPGVQGFHVAPPMPADDFAGWLRASGRAPDIGRAAG